MLRVLRHALLAGLLLVSTAGAPNAGAMASPYGRAAVNRARARDFVSRLFGELRPPPGARRSAHEPPGTHRRLSAPGDDEPTPNLVDAHGWWTIDRPPAAVLAYIAHHLPPDARASGSGSSSVGLRIRDYSLPPVAGLSGRTIAASVVTTAADTTALRLDAEAVWLTPRPEWERITGEVSSASFTGHGATLHNAAGRISRRVRLPAARARRLVTFINALPVLQPGFISCPVGLDEQTTVELDGPHHRRIAQAVESPTGCASITLRIGTRTGPELIDGGAFGSLGDELVRLHAIGTCVAGDLSGSEQSSDSSPSGPELGFAFRNRSADLCAVRGTPGLTLTGARGRVIDGRRRARSDGTVPGVVYPGDIAEFGVRYKRCATRPRATRAQVTIAGVTAPLTVALVPPIRPCTAPRRVGSWSIQSP